MDLTEISKELDELRPEDEEPEDTLRLIMLKLGQVSNALMLLDELDEDSDISDRKIQGVKRDMFAGMVAAMFEFAAEHEIDVERAMDDRLADMRSFKNKQQSGAAVDTDLDPEEDRSFF